MTPIGIFIIVLCGLCGLGTLLLFRINERDYDEMICDKAWHQCAWCKCWYNRDSGVIQLTRPKYAPIKVSDGICDDCFKIEEKKLQDFPANGTSSTSKHAVK